MRGIIPVLAALLLVPTGSAAAQGTKAPADDTSYYGVACTPHAADWQMADASAKPPSAQVDIPKGTRTGIFGCVVGGHAVRINFAGWPVPTYHCGATDDIEVSAWVDGVPVVRKRQAGDYTNCMGDAGGDWQLWRVLINDRMHLTTCERRLDSARSKPYGAGELQGGETSVLASGADGGTRYMISRCTLTMISPTGGRDPYFDGKTIRRTPPAVELSNGTADVCRALVPAMNTTDPAAPRSVLNGHQLTHVTGNGKPYETASEADRSTGEIATYRLDIDNDGVADTITYRDISQIAADEDAVDFPGQYSWTSGKTGQTIELGASALRIGEQWTSKVYADPIRDEGRFVGVGGRVYFYKADNLLASSFINGDVIALETVSGAQDWNTEPSRHLYELHPDGTVTEICGWRARKRPEEFL